METTTDLSNRPRDRVRSLWDTTGEPLRTSTIPRDVGPALIVADAGVLLGSLLGAYALERPSAIRSCKRWPALVLPLAARIDRAGSGSCPWR